MIELSESFSLEYQPLDNDHRRLMKIINDVIKVMDEGNPGECAVLVPEFVDFTRKHFLREEAFLKKLGYPNLQKHYDHHRELNGKMETMLVLAKRAAESELARDSLRKEMTYFLLDDVINADLEFKSYLSGSEPTEEDTSG